MNNDILEIRNAIYTGICIYKRLSRTIVKIENEIVSLEDKKDLSLYLGIIHSQNSISNMLMETELKKDTNIGYKMLEEREFFNVCTTLFNESLINTNFETLEEYFYSLLNKDIVIKLNREYNFKPFNFMSNKNKQLIKK